MPALFRNLAVLLAGVTAGLLTPELHAQTQYLGWHTDLDKAAQVARETGRPLFVVFRCER